MVWAGSMSVIAGCGVAAQPLLVKFIIDDGMIRPNASPTERFYYTLIFVGLYFLASFGRILFWGIGVHHSVQAIEGILFSVRAKFFRHVQGLCMRFHSRVSSGELFNYIMGSPTSSLKMYLSFFIMSLPTNIVSFVISVGALAMFDVPMTVILLVTVTLIVILNSRSRRTVRNMTANFMETESSVSRFVADMMRGCRAIKLYAIENHVSEDFEQHLGEIRQKGAHLSFYQWIEGAKPEMAHYAGLAIIYLYGAYSCIYRNLTVGKFMAFVTCVGSVMGPLMSYLQSNLLKANAEAGLERIQRILDTEKSTPECLDQVSCEEAEKTAKITHLPCLEFDQVQFAYDENTRLFDGLNCSIRRGESLALVGPSGSGKSSFANLALRLFDPQSGTIRMNGVDIKKFGLQDLRSCFGVVPQDPFLFQTSIYDNIRAAVPQATESEVLAAMKLAYVDDFVQQLPQGAKTLVGEGGTNLSGGQRQRIAIARAILAKPKILIFDEATSALDNESERRIQTAIDDLMEGRTVIIIAHRLSTIRRVDRILVFEKGKVVQQGSYAELAEKPGLFHDLLDNSDK